MCNSTEPRVGDVTGWAPALAEALRNSCTCPDAENANLGSGGRMFFRTQVPMLFQSGLTPGPFYHSHPHVASEFDAVPTDLPSQMQQVIGTVFDIARNAGLSEVEAKAAWETSGYMINWVTGGKYTEAKEACNGALISKGLEPVPASYFPIVRCSTDLRFHFESMPFMSVPSADIAPGTMKKIDIKESFDAQYFMPYLAGQLIPASTELVLFTIDARGAGPGGVTPESAEDQAVAVVDGMIRVLQSEGCGKKVQRAPALCAFGETRADREAAFAAWDGVIIVLNKAVNLKANEEPFLMTRSRKGLERPVCEALMEVDSLGNSPDGVPLLLEYVVLAARDVTPA
mmetsp:Transcript_89867/g.159885  ORF Transcript_89867/g.159885 Transcript_89867/m.159885 type:complete len:343 (+) Transcript_89867:84-1112(+)